MQRRGFLGAILAACAAPAIIRVQSLMPIRALAPRIWTSDELAFDFSRVDVIYGMGGNTLLTAAMVTQQALKILGESRTFASNEVPFKWHDSRPVWQAPSGQTIAIRRPPRLSLVGR